MVSYLLYRPRSSSAGAPGFEPRYEGQQQRTSGRGHWRGGEERGGEGRGAGHAVGDHGLRNREGTGEIEVRRELINGKDEINASLSESEASQAGGSMPSIDVSPGAVGTAPRNASGYGRSPASSIGRGGTGRAETVRQRGTRRGEEPGGGVGSALGIVREQSDVAAVKGFSPPHASEATRWASLDHSRADLDHVESGPAPHAGAASRMLSGALRDTNLAATSGSILVGQGDATGDSTSLNANGRASKREGSVQGLRDVQEGNDGASHRGGTSRGATTVGLEEVSSHVSQDTSFASVDSF